MPEWLVDIHVGFTVEAKTHEEAVEAVWEALPSDAEIAPNGKLERVAENRMFKPRAIGSSREKSRG